MQNVTKFIFFDFDGVIIDSEPLYQRFWIEACKVHGFDLSIEQELSLRSQDHAITTKFFIDTFGPNADYEKIVKTRKELMNEYLKNTQIPVKSGVKEVFEYIKNNTDIKIAIVSSSSEDYVKHHASYNGVLSYIDKIVSVKNHVSRGKPYPDVYLKALEFTNANKEEVIVLEDSPNGVTSAYRAGLRVIFIKDLSPADDNIKEKTIYQLDNIKELIKIIRGEISMKQSLCFAWRYIDNYQEDYLNALPKDAIDIDIPHNLFDVPYNYFNEQDYQKVVTYEKLFDVLDKDILNKTSILRFEGFMLQGDIYLNGHHLGHHVSGYLPVEIDVSAFIKEKDNRLVVVLDSKEDNTIPPFGYAVDYLTFSGIYREVYLLTYPKTYLKDIYAYADMNGNVIVTSTKEGKEDIDITYHLFNKEHELIISSKDDHFHIEKPILWDIDNPYLYLLEIETSNGEKYYSRVGFRTINANQYGFFLNEKPLKLRGLNRHQNYPYVGYAMPKSMQEDDAIKLKELGINVVRTSHYPQSEHFLSKCDELGLLVLDEVPGWQHISKENKWRDHYYDFIKRMVLKERNHPCLFAYGVRIDESKDDHELYQKGNQIAHELDPYRFTIGVRNTRNSELLEDIYGYNDFTCADMNKGLIEPKKITKVKEAPILITEYMGHMEPVKATSDIEKRKQVALRHAKVLDDCLKYERLMGCIGWCFADYYTHVDFGSGDHLCPHGVVDLFRNKKYTTSIYESQSDNHPVMDILTNMRPGDFKEATYQDIIIATNMDRIDLYKNDEFVASFYPKHDRFKYLKHPPIYITDILGESFKDGNFNKKERKAITEVMSYGGLYGYGNLKLKHVIKVGKMAMKYHLNWDDLTDIWNKHIATWGGYAKTFTFVGIKNNQELLRKTIAPSSSFHMNYQYDRTQLKEEDSYDVLPIKVSFVDKDNNVMPYANKPIKVEVEGNISLLGPSLQTLLGGQITLYIRSHGKGKGKVIITSEIEQKEIELQVL